MKKYDYALNATRQRPVHSIVEADTRREVARVHQEDDVHLLVNALERRADVGPFAYTYVHTDGRRDWRLAGARRAAEFGWTETPLYL